MKMLFGLLVPFLAFSQVSSQDVSEPSPRIDILFVVDDSSSVEDPQERQLFSAIRGKDVLRMRSLIEDEGLDVNLRYTTSELFRNWTPLMFAAYHTRASMVRYLVDDLGADPCLELGEDDARTALDIVAVASRKRYKTMGTGDAIASFNFYTRERDIIEFLSMQGCR